MSEAMQDGLALCQRDSSIKSHQGFNVLSCEKAEGKKALGAWKIVTGLTHKRNDLHAHLCT